MIQVDPLWWQTLFDDVYLITDANIVCNPPLTKHEVDIVEQVLCLRSSDRILDLCGGQGRHALELARRGYPHVVVVDYTPFLIHLGQQDAIANNLTVAFCQGDARSIPLQPESVDAVLLMANSFGYFVEPADDLRVLHEMAQVLKPGGQLFLDFTDYEHVQHHFVPQSWHEATADILVCWQRERIDDVVRVREIALSKTKGLLRDRTYAERLYPPAHLQTLLPTAGFTEPAIHQNAFIFDSGDDTDYGIATHRMLATAHKA